MTRFAYYTSPNGFRDVRGEMLTAVTGLPGWARMIVGVLALPGICLIGLSLLLLAASIATLLLLTVPAYSLLRRLVGRSPGRGSSPDSARADVPQVIEAKVIEARTVE